MERQNELGVLAAAVVLGALTAAAYGRQAPPANKHTPLATVVPPAPLVSPPADKKHGNFEAVDWHHNEQTQTGTARNFTYRENDVTVSGDQVRYDDKSKLLDATGNLTLNDSKYHLTGDKAHIDYGPHQKIADFTGSVNIVVKPASAADAAPSVPAPADAGSSSHDLKSERGHGVTINCDSVRDYYRRKYAILRGHLVFHQAVTGKDGHVINRTLTCEHAEYDGKADRMHLFAPVHGTDSDDQQLDFSQDVFVGTKEGAETLETHGPVKGNILRVNDSDTSDEGAAPPPDTTAAPGTAPAPAPASPTSPAKPPP